MIMTRKARGEAAVDTGEKDMFVLRDGLPESLGVFLILPPIYPQRMIALFAKDILLFFTTDC